MLFKHTRQDEEKKTYSIQKKVTSRHKLFPLLFVHINVYIEYKGKA